MALRMLFRTDYGHTPDVRIALSLFWGRFRFFVLGLVIEVPDTETDMESEGSDIDATYDDDWDVHDGIVPSSSSESR